MFKRRIATVLAAAAGFVVLGASAAYADVLVVSVNNGIDRGWAKWTEDGDTLTVCDQSADGWGVRGYIYVPEAVNQENGTVLIKASDGNSTDGCVAVSKNLSETVHIAIKVCMYAGSVVDNCEYKIIR